jgi:signal peptidase I
MSVLASPETATEPRPRSRVLAGLLSLIAPGSGHVYAGRTTRGALLFAVLFAIQALAILAAPLMPPRFTPIVVLIGIASLVALAVYLFGVVDAARLAGRPGAAPRWPVMAGAVAAVWIGSFAASELLGLVKPLVPWRIFSVSSSSMEPTLRFGERFVADMIYFDTHAPAAGDLVVYRLPKDPDTIYIKRIVSRGGDRIVFREGRAVVNGTATADPGIKVLDPRSPYNNSPEFAVPAGHVFVAGDNRSNSTDSRVASHGFVPVGNLIGRANEIFWSGGAGREGMQVR